MGYMLSLRVEHTAVAIKGEMGESIRIGLKKARNSWRQHHKTHGWKSMDSKEKLGLGKDVGVPFNKCLRKPAEGDDPLG